MNIKWKKYDKENEDMIICLRMINYEIYKFYYKRIGLIKDNIYKNKWYKRLKIINNDE